MHGFKYNAIKMRRIVYLIKLISMNIRRLRGNIKRKYLSDLIQKE